ncbi:hypothetical protein [Microcystis phage Mel-JY01]
MSLEYSVKDVGYVGSIIYPPELINVVGKTIEVKNETNSRKYTGNNPVYFSVIEGIDVNEMTRLYPLNSYGAFQYGIKKLSDIEIQEYSNSTKISPEYLKELNVLFLRNPLGYDEYLPIRTQSDWTQFEYVDVGGMFVPKYILSNVQNITRYSFLIPENELNILTQFLLEIPSNNTEIYFDPRNSIQASSEIQFELQNDSNIFVENETIIENIPNIDMSFDENVQEDMVPIIAQISATEQFMKLINTTPEQFHITKEEGDGEYNRIYSLLISSIEKLKMQLTAGGISFNTTNVIPNIELFLIILRYIDFQKQNSYPDFSKIVINNYGDFVEFSLMNNEVQTEQIVESVFDSEIDTFDELIDQIIYDLTEDDDGIYTNKKISKLEDYSAPILRKNTGGLWNGGDENLKTFFTGSSNQYYINVHDKNISECSSKHQFSISFAHISGSGSSVVVDEQQLYPSRIMFSKYMMECHSNNYGKFPFKNNVNGDYFYTIQLHRNDFRDNLDPGNFQICLAQLSGSTVDVSSSFYYTLIDESYDDRQKYSSIEDIKEYYYITSGSLNDGVYTDETDNAWGVVFPKKGLIILDGKVLDMSCSFQTFTGSTYVNNAFKLFQSISGSSSPTLFRTFTGSFFARSSEDVLTETYFCRANYNEFNYSTNYTYMTGSNGEIKNLFFKNSPTTYITTIGLYDRNNNLVAVGKLPKPMLKDNTKEYIFQVKLKLN